VESAAISQGTVQTPNGDTNDHPVQDDPEMMDEDQIEDSKKDTTTFLIKERKKKIPNIHNIYLSWPETQ